MDSRTVIGIVGGGLAGLVAARSLARQGHEVEIFEGATALGGMIAAADVGGVSVDIGAEAYATRSDVVRDLCAELGLDVAPPAALPHVWWPSRGIHRLASGIAGIPAAWDDPAWDVLETDEFVVAQRDRYLAVQPAQTVGALVRARLGDAALDYVVAPVIRGVYGTDPDVMPLDRVATGLMAAVEREGSLIAAVAATKKAPSAVEQPLGGMSHLVTALERDLAASQVVIHRDTPITGVEFIDNGWWLHSHDRSWECTTWVSAAPRAVFAKLLAPLGIEVPQAPTAAARNILLALRHPDLLKQPIGSGIVVGAPGQGLRARAVTHYSAKWQWAADRDVQVVRVSWPQDDDADLTQVLADVATLTGVPLGEEDLVDSRDVVWDAMPRPMAPADRDRVTAISQELKVPVVGAWYCGNGLTPVVAAAQEVRV